MIVWSIQLTVAAAKSVCSSLIPYSSAVWDQTSLWFVSARVEITSKTRLPYARSVSNTWVGSDGLTRHIKTHQASKLKAFLENGSEHCLQKNLWYDSWSFPGGNQCKGCNWDQKSLSGLYLSSISFHLLGSQVAVAKLSTILLGAQKKKNTIRSTSGLRTFKLDIYSGCWISICISVWL